MDRDSNENEDMELEDVGAVSEDTHGSVFGHTWDGGFGHRPP